MFKLSGASQPANLKANVEVGLSGVHFTGVEGEIGRKQLQKSSMQIAVGEEARATGQIEFNELSIADLSAFAFGVDASAAASGIWSSARFPTFSPWPIPFDVEVRAPRLAISSGLSLSGASLRLVSRGLNTLAISSFQASIEKDSKNPLYHYHLGLAYAKNGDKDKARDSLKQALSLNPKFDGAGEAQKTLASL